MWTGWKRTGQGSERSAAAAGQRRMNGRMAPSMGPEIGRGLTAHALAFTLLSLAGLVLVVFPLARQAHIERQAETPASVAREREGTASLFAVIDEALPRADIKRARAAWHDAYRIALPRGDWQEMAALGDVALRRGATGAHIGDTEARQAYLGALFRARAQASLDGVMRAIEGFATLGDRDVVEEGLRIADGLARASDESQASERVLALRTRLDPRAGFGEAGPSRPPRWEAGP